MIETATVNVPENSKNNLKAVLIIGGVALFIVGTSVGVYFLLKKKKEKAIDLENNSDQKAKRDLEKPIGLQTNQPTRSTGFSCSNKSYPLKDGTCHPDVGILQQYLKKMYQADLGTSGANKDGVDGKFGAATKKAAIKYLSTFVFTPKDIIGIKTALKFIPK